METKGESRKCASPIEHTSNTKAICKNWLHDELRVEWLASPEHLDGFYLLCPKKQRELILLPKDGYQRNGTKHLTNRELVNSLDAWKAILGIALQLGAQLERISTRFCPI
ncbi:hypothetical protein WJX73_005476 [Symbiochloris irregularis]|uniref:Uncharacterized protein n=1 Tax=Symbiochloris irregularis TaxID=706552 RepID=A0AAW1PGY5_9CHLO